MASYNSYIDCTDTQRDNVGSYTGCLGTQQNIWITKHTGKTEAQTFWIPTHSLGSQIKSQGTFTVENQNNCPDSQTDFLKEQIL